MYRLGGITKVPLRSCTIHLQVAVPACLPVSSSRPTKICPRWCRQSFSPWRFRKLLGALAWSVRPWHLSWGGGETATPKNETIEEGKRRQNWFMGYQKGHGWVLKAKIFNGASTLEVALKTIAFLWWKLMRKKFRLGVSGHSVFSSASSLLQCHEPQKSNDVDLSCSKNCGDVARSFWYFGTVVCCTRYLISLLDFVTCGVWRTCCFSKRQSHHTVDIRLMHSKPQHCKGSSRNNVSEPRK